MFLTPKGCKGHETKHQQAPISYLHEKFEQSRSTTAKVTFKGCCGLCLAFDCKGYVTRLSGWSISYLHAKFEQNWSINAKVTFKGRCGLCLAFDCKGRVTSLRIHFSLSVLFGATAKLVVLWKMCFEHISLKCPWWPFSEVTKYT